MQINFRQFIPLTLFISLLIFSWLIFSPRSYNVLPSEKMAAKQYWQLSTGSDISYIQIAGKGEKKPYPIIYLHGGPGGFIDGEKVRILAPLAEDGYDIYLYDQVGGGQSSRLKNISEYTPDRHKRDLEEIVKQIGAEKVIFIAQSWGAILAVLFIADNSGKVERAIFTGPGPIPPVNLELAQEKTPDSLNLCKPYFSNAEGNRKAYNIRAKAILKWAEWTHRKLATDAEADAFMAFLNDKLNKSTVCDTSMDTRTHSGSGFYSHIMTMKYFNQVEDPRTVIRTLQIPILVMKGQCDNQKWGYTHEYLKLFQKNRLVVIPNAGHSIATEQPAKYLQTIRDFLAE